MTLATEAPSIPLPRFAADPPPARPPVDYRRPLAEIDRDLGDLAVQEQRHRDMLAGARRALADCAVRRELLADQRRRSIARAVEQLDG